MGDDEIRECVFDILRTSKVYPLTPRKVKQLAEANLGVILDEKTAWLRQCTNLYIDSLNQTRRPSENSVTKVSASPVSSMASSPANRNSTGEAPCQTVHAEDEGGDDGAASSGSANAVDRGRDESGVCNSEDGIPLYFAPSLLTSSSSRRRTGGTQGCWMFLQLDDPRMSLHGAVPRGGMRCGM